MMSLCQRRFKLEEKPRENTVEAVEAVKAAKYETAEVTFETTVHTSVSEKIMSNKMEFRAFVGQHDEQINFIVYSSLGFDWQIS